MIAIRRIAEQFTAWIQTCGLLCIGIGLALALGAASVHFFGHALSDSAAGPIWLGAAVYLVLAGAGLAGLRIIYLHRGTHAFLWTVLVASMLIQLATIQASDPQWKWTGDAQIFQHYLNRLAENGYAAETLGELSQNYDYPIWTRRALPFYYVLRIGAGDHFVQAVQLFQALLVSFSLALTWRISRLLFGERAPFWAVSLQFLMPFRWFICLDLCHYILGSFYFLSALWVMIEWMHGKPGSARKWILAVVAGLLLPLMRLECGIDQIYLVSAAGTLLFQWAKGNQTHRQTLVASLAWLAGPLLIATLVLSPLSDRIDQANRHRLSSGTGAFLARGWMPETGGEYSATYEQIDWLTPLESKKTVMSSLVASQVYYNSPTLLFRLLPVKLAKYFLLGYASGAEEMLVHNGAEQWALHIKGARVAYLLAALPLMIWGSLLLIPLLHRSKLLCWTLTCLIFFASTSLLGETSPRYSIYIQPFLFLLGALPLSWNRPHCHCLLRSSRVPVFVACASLGILFVLIAGIIVAARPWLQSHAMQDMRLLKIHSPAQAIAIPSTLAPFEIRLPAVQPAPTWGTIQLPVPTDEPATFSFYILPMAGLSASHGTPAILRRQTAAGETKDAPLVLPTRVIIEFGVGDPKSFELRSAESPPPFSVTIGYANLRGRE